MGENIILGGFLVLPVLLGWGILVFFRKLKQSPGPRNWRILLLGNTLILLQLLSVVLLGGELYYRFIYDTTDAFGLSKTTAKWFKRHFHWNVDGYRDSVDYTLKVPPGQRRLTFLGDSFTAGHGVPDVEDRFANRVRAMQIFDEVHVIAQVGFDGSHELGELQKLKVYDYEYDTFVLVYCLNDISDLVPEWLAIHDKIYEDSSPGFLVEHSYFLNMLHSRLRAARNPNVLDYYSFIEDAYTGSIWEEQQQRLQRMKEQVQAQGGRFLVVTFPFLHDLGPDYRYRIAHENLDRFWRDQGVPHLDLLSLYEDQEPETLVVNSRDPHPNELAHSIAADAVGEFLKEQLQVSPAALSDPHDQNADLENPVSSEQAVP